MNSVTVTPLKIRKTSRTPEVLLDPAMKQFKISGRSIPEDSIAFYQQINNWVTRYSQSGTWNDKMSLQVELEYFNTSSSKCLLDLFKRINKCYNSGLPAGIEWIYDEEDEDLMEMGEDYADLLDLPFNLTGVEY